MATAINKKPAAGTAGQGTTRGVNARQIYYNAAGRPVASLCGSTLRKVVRGSIHQLRRPPAWAVDAGILEQARQDGATQVEVLDVETRRIYRASIDTFDLHGFKFNRGFGEQWGLALHYWRVEAEGVKQLALEF